MVQRKNRPFYKLYEIVYKYYLSQVKDLDKNNRSGGICLIIDELYYEKKMFSKKEFLKLKKHFKLMKPTPFINKQFYYLEDKLPTNDSFYFVEKNYQIRLKFLNYLIEITKPWYVRWLEK